eukprot:TRINITY_DN7618_c0_g1_i1.p1 TRINITY_DN7618_c0_g1~~TRINITY_DN7618_c0_g1_i1.p1  ORF type:complete len:604 (-),score=130.05 TRINITY_DN7618_c0_g1_i1:223-1971(-)
MAPAEGSPEGVPEDVVKVEEGAAAADATTSQAVPEEAKLEGEEIPDFGEEEPNPPPPTRIEPAALAPKKEPRRAIPDYRDIVEDDSDVSLKMMYGSEANSVPSVPPAMEGDKRPDAVHIFGVQRLTRTHIEEVLDSKELPKFHRIEWISDEAAICVFQNAEAATKVLEGAVAGFGNTQVENGQPGPGLWRAQRGMLDFRLAYTGDKQALGWKKLHRGGRQVREYRFWEAIKDLDREILEKEDAQAQSLKRPAALITPGVADEWAKFKNEFSEPQKRARTNPLPPVFPMVKEKEEIEGEGGIALLEEMAKQDAAILKREECPAPKEEKEGEAAPGGNAPPASGTWPAGAAGGQRLEWPGLPAGMPPGMDSHFAAWHATYAGFAGAYASSVAAGAMANAKTGSRRVVMETNRGREQDGQSGGGPRDGPPNAETWQHDDRDGKNKDHSWQDVDKNWNPKRRRYFGPPTWTPREGPPSDGGKRRDPDDWSNREGYKRSWSWDSWDSWQSWKWLNGGKGKGKGNDRKRYRDDESEGNSSSLCLVGGVEFTVDEAELARRNRRYERFQSQTASKDQTDDTTQEGESNA